MDYRKISLYELEHGRTSDGKIRLGTLELLGDDEIVGAPPDTFVWDDDDIVDPDTKAALANTKVVLTNPPFSDNTKRNRNVDEDTKRAMQAREKDLRARMLASDEAAGGLIDINSIRTFFTPLIDCVLDRDDGVLAKISYGRGSKGSRIGYTSARNTRQASAIAIHAARALRHRAARVAAPAPDRIMMPK